MSSLNIDKETDLTADVYGINQYVNKIKKDFTPGVNEDTLMLGIFGYLGQNFSDMLQNTIVMASEFSNESIPYKAKFEKNVIAHALGLGITDINAEPAQLDVLLTFIEDDIIRWANAVDADGNEKPWRFVFDKDTPIYIGDFCFHTDYDIDIRKILLENAGEENKFAYTAKYIMPGEITPAGEEVYHNPISDVTNPYLTSPVRMFVNGMNIIFVKCTLHQAKKTQIHKKVLSDNSISAKTVTFNFEGQLAAFTIDVKEGQNLTHMVPVYDGLSVEPQKYPYFYYSFLDSNTIRIKFDRYSYQPRINSDVTIDIWTTEGEAGNFTFDPEIYPGYAFESERYEYSNIGCEIRPVTGESAYGTDKKTVEDLKKVIPKEALSRGSITNLADLENYFNMLDTELSKMYFYKKRDNALERLYYAFMVMRDKLNVIVPTNTIDLKVRPQQLMTEDGSMKLVFKRGQMIRLVEDFGYLYEPVEGEVPDYGASFYYVIPYNFIINTYPLYGMYILTTMDAKKFLDFTYINDQCLYQYIATNIYWYRGYIENPDTYEMSISLEQNVEDGSKSMIETDEEGNETVNIRVVAVFYNEEDNAHRWAEAEYDGADDSANIYHFKFKFTSQDYIDIHNRIRIDTGLYDIGTENESYAHFKSNAKCVIHILSKQDGSGLNGLDKLIPNLDGWVLSNSYTVGDGIDWFYDYSEITESVVIAEKEDENGENGIGDVSPEELAAMIAKVGVFRAVNPYAPPIVAEQDETEDIELNEGENGGLVNDESLNVNPDEETYVEYPKDGGQFDPDYMEEEDDGTIDVSTAYFRIKSVPVVRADYFTDDGKVIDFCNELISRKNYIDYAIQILEDAFGMDFKFFNTYGPSKLFTIDNELDYVNRTNLTLTFKLKLRPNYDTNIINDMIADIKDYIEDINEIASLHMPNLITFITNKYEESIVFFEFVDMNGYGPGVQHLYSMQMPDEVVTPEFLNVQALPDGTPDINIIMM